MRSERTSEEGHAFNSIKVRLKHSTTGNALGELGARFQFHKGAIET